MSLINEIVSRVDVNIDRLYSHTPEPFEIESIDARGLNARDSRQLQSAVRALSVENHGLLSRRNLLRVLAQSQTNKLFAFPTAGEGVDHHETSDEQSWFVVAKFTAQTLGTVLQILLEQSSLLGAEIEYWDDVLGSRLYTTNYAIQVAPWTAWEWMIEVLSNVRTASVRENFTSMTTINRDWRRFYQLVQNNIRRGLTHNTTNTLSSPFTRYRLHLRRRRQTLEELKDLTATAVGILLEECLTFATLDGSSDANPAKSNRERGYALYRTALLTEKTIDNLSQPLDSSKNVEEQIFLVTDNAFRDKQGFSKEAHPVAPIDVVERLVHVLKYCVPEYLTYNRRFIRAHGRPSVFARYWFPTTATLFSLSTSLRFITNHQAELLQWLSELGQTSVDFWQNWVLQPIQKIIGTIRHDEQSEIAIMSRRSLEADRQSLERMVVDFVSDNASHRASGNPESDTATLIAQVREGDLTPVLKAYERDLRKPFLGTVRGDLVRAVLIQIQKTKVDIEVAMGGIDSLLKSQELVFGFIGLTPGLLITYSTMRWIAGLFDSRKGFRAGLQRQGFRGSVRNLDRILGVYTTQPDSVLSYRDYGLCIYEAQILKQRAQYTLPRSFIPSFQQDLMDLTDLSHGVRRQRNALHRIEWTYSKWL